jgi:hypothetical protein
MKLKNPFLIFKAVYGQELIERYFSPTPNKELDEEPTDGIFCVWNTIKSFEQFDTDKVRIYFKRRMEFRDEPIYENGERVGMIRLVEPHTITNQKGTIICSGVTRVREGKVTAKWRIVDVKISRALWSNRLNIKIKNNNLNVAIKCEKIYYESYFSETVYLSERVNFDSSEMTVS